MMLNIPEDKPVSWKANLDPLRRRLKILGLVISDEYMIPHFRSNIPK
jgi:hypothetical protein